MMQQKETKNGNSLMMMVKQYCWRLVESCFLLNCLPDDKRTWSFEKAESSVMRMLSPLWYQNQGWSCSCSLGCWWQQEQGWSCSCSWDPRWKEMDCWRMLVPQIHWSLVAVAFADAAGLWFEEHSHMQIRCSSAAELSSLRPLLAVPSPGLAIR